MHDMEKVVRDLRYLKSFGRVSNNPQITEIAESALELLKEQETMMQCIKGKCRICPHCSNCDVDENGLLKEQEAVEPIPPTDESDLWKCGNCNHQLFRCTHQRYCEMCGKAVKWDV